MEYVISILSIVCFFIGFFTGIKVGKAMKGEQVKILPDIKNPIDVYKERKERKIVEEQQQQLITNLENINNYTGDSSNQKDF